MNYVPANEQYTAAYHRAKTNINKNAFQNSLSLMKTFVNTLLKIFVG